MLSFPTLIPSPKSHPPPTTPTTDSLTILQPLDNASPRNQHQHQSRQQKGNRPKSIQTHGPTPRQTRICLPLPYPHRVSYFPLFPPILLLLSMSTVLSFAPSL